MSDDENTPDVESTEDVEIDKPTETKEESAEADTPDATGTGRFCFQRSDGVALFRRNL